MKPNFFKYIFLLTIVSIFILPKLAFGAIEISEIMYDASGTDTDHEWIEIRSTGGTTDMSEYKFYDTASHSLNPIGTNGSTGSMIIADGGYAIITGNATTFLVDHAGFTGTVIDTVMSLNNSGGTVKILNKNGDALDIVNYSSSLGANGDGNSLQKNGTTFSPATPTPGIANILGQSGTDPTTPKNDTSEVLFSSDGADVDILSITNATNINENVEFVFDAKIVNAYGDNVTNGYFHWSFGDGNEKTTNKNEKFPYTYEIAGQYIVTLTASKFSSAYGEGDHMATKSFLINVGSGNISLGVIRIQSKLYLEIKNNMDKIFDISGFVIKSGEKQIVIPKNTIISANGHLVIQGQNNIFEEKDFANINMFYPNGKFFTSYTNAVVEPKKLSFKSIKIPNTISNSSQTASLVAVQDSNNIPEITNSLNLDDKNAGKDKKTKNNSTILLLVLLVALSCGLVYFIRSKDHD